MEVITKMQLKLEELNKDRNIIKNCVLNFACTESSNNIQYNVRTYSNIYTLLYIQMIKEISQIK